MWSIFAVSGRDRKLFGEQEISRFILLAALVSLMLVLAGCGSDEQVSPTPPIEVTVETGGMALPGSVESGAATNTTESVAAPAATEKAVLSVGAMVVARDEADIFAEPDQAAARFAQYAAGSQFTIVEPDGEFTMYPVEVDGQHWYRVRAEDGLVGWVVDQDVVAE